MKKTEAIEWLEVMKENVIFEQYDALKMAIEALKEQEISNELQEYAYECGYERFFHECQNCEHRRIGNKADRWIPCSERLPSKDGRYLVCMPWEYKNMETVRVEVFQWVDGWNCYRDYDGKIDREHEIDGAKIVAWMPLPTPYKGGDDE